MNIFDKIKKLFNKPITEINQSTKTNIDLKTTPQNELKDDKIESSNNVYIENGHTTFHADGSRSEEHMSELQSP